MVMDRVRIKDDPDSATLRVTSISDVFESGRTRSSDTGLRESGKRDDTHISAEAGLGQKSNSLLSKSTANTNSHIAGASENGTGGTTHTVNGQRRTPSPPELVYGPPVDKSSGDPAKKLRRLLSILLHFGREVSDEPADRVKHLILALVSGCLTVDEFHSSLQEATHYPLRPFVLPFLRQHLPALQREILALARAAKQSLPQYLSQHEALVFDAFSAACDASEVFSSEAYDLRKRAHSDSLLDSSGNDSAFSPMPKRPALYPGSILPPPSMAPFQSGPSPPNCAGARDGISRADEARVEDGDEWRNIHVMLNCILSMVEKTRRALSILQGRCGRAESVGWNQQTQPPPPVPPPAELHRHAADWLSQTVRATEERVAEIRRQAEESVNEVKRHALRELRRAVCAAETRASELLADERLRVDLPHVHDPRPLNGEDTRQQQLSPENCWNCGRRASETCSGCGLARYCGSFCQHKDWQLHRTRCGQMFGSGGSSTPSAAAGDLRTGHRTSQPLVPSASAPNSEHTD